MYYEQRINKIFIQFKTVFSMRDMYDKYLYNKTEIQFTNYKCVLRFVYEKLSETKVFV